MHLFRTDDPEIAAKELEDAARDLIEELDRAIPLALRGREGAARAYIRTWKGLSCRCLRLAHETLPDLVLETERGELLLVDAKHTASPVGKPLLDYLALNAPFSPWVSRFGAGRGAAVFLLSELREAVPGLSPIALGHGESALPHWDINREDFARFVRHVWLELEEERPLLERIAGVFDLTRTELARLFGVRRQAVSQWLDEGVPAARQPKALVVNQIADLLEQNLMGGRIPAVARTPARAYGGLSMLDMIAENRHEELLQRIRTSFDWAATA